MSGGVPDFIEKNHYVLCDGKKRLVTGHFHTSSGAPYVPNTDRLMIEFGGVAREYDQGIRPLKAVDVPSWLKEGAVVRIKRGKGDCEGLKYAVVGGIRGEQAKNDPKIKTVVTLVVDDLYRGNGEWFLADLAPVTKKDAKGVKALMDIYTPEKKRHDDREAEITRFGKRMEELSQQSHGRCNVLQNFFTGRRCGFPSKTM